MTVALRCRFQASAARGNFVGLGSMSSGDRQHARLSAALRRPQGGVEPRLDREAHRAHRRHYAGTAHLLTQEQCCASAGVGECSNRGRASAGSTSYACESRRCESGAATSCRCSAISWRRVHSVFNGLRPRSRAPSRRGSSSTPGLVTCASCATTPIAQDVLRQDRPARHRPRLVPEVVTTVARTPTIH